MFQCPSISIGSLPIKLCINSSTAVLTVAALPSITGSPQPVMPSSVPIFRNNQRGGTWNNYCIVLSDFCVVSCRFDDLQLPALHHLPLMCCNASLTVVSITLYSLFIIISFVASQVPP